MTPANQNKNTLLVATCEGARLFRMNVGLAWIGKVLKPDKPITVNMRPGDVLIRNARPFKAGVKGMSDSGGWKSVTITPEMVGQKIAQHLAVEDKLGTGRPSPEQKAYIKAVRAAGGLAGVSRCDDDTRAIIAGEIRD